MKRNADKIPVEVNDETSRLRIVETSHRGSGVADLSLPSAHTHQPRPEIAVLGWDVRSYRLSLRESKA